MVLEDMDFRASELSLYGGVNRGPWHRGLPDQDLIAIGYQVDFVELYPRAHRVRELLDHKFVSDGCFVLMCA